MTTKVIIAYLKYACTSSIYMYMNNISNNNPLERFNGIVDNKHKTNIILTFLCTCLLVTTDHLFSSHCTEITLQCCLSI